MIIMEGNPHEFARLNVRIFLSAIGSPWAILSLDHLIINENRIFIASRSEIDLVA